MRPIPSLLGSFLAMSFLAAFSPHQGVGTAEQVVAGKLGDADITTIVGL